MRFPLGDWLRKIVKPNSFFGKILGITKGHSVSVGGHEIGLSEGHGPSAPASGDPFHKPSKPGPQFGPGRNR